MVEIGTFVSGRCSWNCRRNQSRMEDSSRRSFNETSQRALLTESLHSPARTSQAGSIASQNEKLSISRGMNDDDSGPESLVGPFISHTLNLPHPPTRENPILIPPSLFGRFHAPGRLDGKYRSQQQL